MIERVMCKDCMHFKASEHSKSGLGKCRRGMASQDYHDYQSQTRTYVVWRMWEKPHFPSALRVCEEHRKIE